MKYVKVVGRSARGTRQEINYCYAQEASGDDYKAIKLALLDAAGEYAYDKDENRQIIPNSEHKQFVYITSVEIIGDY